LEKGISLRFRRQNKTMKWLLCGEYTIVTDAARLSLSNANIPRVGQIWQAKFRLVDHVYRFISDVSRRLLSTLKKPFRDKIPHIIEILNYHYDIKINSNNRTSKLCQSSRYWFRLINANNDHFHVLLQSFYCSNNNDELKTIDRKNQNASSRDIVAELEAHMNISSDLKTIENPSKHSQITVLKQLARKNQKNITKRRWISKVTDKIILILSATMTALIYEWSVSFMTQYDINVQSSIPKVCRTNTQ